jgi:multiple sugar transport system permease protein
MMGFIDVIKRGGFFFVIGIGALVMLFPLLWMVSTSLKTGEATFVIPPQMLPAHPTLENLARVFRETNFARFVVNSTIVSVCSTFLFVMTSAMAGYAFARANWPGKNILFLGYLGTLMVPQQVTLTPLFIVMTSLGWANTYQALIVPGAVSAFGTFMMRQFFLSIPKEVEEAALLDGAGLLRIFFTIGLHLAKPALATLTVLGFMASCNNFLWPLVSVSVENMMTRTLGV